LTVLSHDPEARSLPSGEKATDATESVWPASVFNTASRPVETSHSCTTSSLDPEARSLPSGEKATEVAKPELKRVCLTCPEATSHSFTVSSLDPEASTLPSGEKVTEKIQSES
jgi:hypothetical protein